VIIVINWCASSNGFFIMGFYIKYIHGNIFINIITTSIADALSSIFAGIIAEKIGAKNTLFLSFGLAGTFATLIIFAEHPVIILTSVFITRFGISSAFTLCYIVTADYFPSIVSSQVFGICRVFAGFATSLSPMIAEMEAPVPMVVYIFTCMLSMASSLFLTKSEDVEDAMRELDDSVSMHSFMWKSSTKGSNLGE
jgi:OCT family organic cation transporter-like MFS transporter 4/5